MKTILFTLAFALLFCGKSAMDPGDQSEIKKANQFYAQGKTQEALRIYNSVYEKYPDDSNPGIMSARIYYYKQEFDTAEKILRSIVEKDEANANARFWLAKVISVDKKNNKEVLAFLDGILKKNQNHLEAWHLKGIIHEKEGELKEAIASYRMGIAEGEKLADIYVQLGNLYKKAELNDMAREHFRIAKTINPDNLLLKSFNN